MWADNETTDDLLGFNIHCHFIENYINNKNLLPITIGVFGDWGSGKSSIIKMLEEKFSKNEKVLSIYFNGWLFEGYEDAKSALIENIILELSKNQNLSSEAKKNIIELFKSIDYMKAVSDGAKKYGKNIVDILATGGIGTAVEVATDKFSNTDISEEIENLDEKDLKEYLKKEQKNKNRVTIKNFRSKFKELINTTDFDSIVIFIDDLDRCLPDRIVDTLEAIKLFISVPKIAFVIGADERIVRHAIAHRYQLHLFKDSSYLKDSEQIVTDYLEKLIQIPYRVPKLSPSEIESYINLLFCYKDLKSEQYKQVVEDYKKFREDDFYTAYSFGYINKIINLESGNLQDLSKLLQLSHTISSMITDILKGNPRQIKRFLNTFMIRKNLALVAKMNIDDYILIKLMLLEYSTPNIFKELNELLSKSEGIINELKLLEEVYINNNEDVKKELEKLKINQEWNSEKIIKWIKLEPKLQDADLRNYFWLVRDKTGSTLSDIHMVSPHIQKIYSSLINSDKHIRDSAVLEVSNLTNEDKNEIINLLLRDIKSNPTKFEVCIDVFGELVQNNKNVTFQNEYLYLLKDIPFNKIKDKPEIASQIRIIIKTNANLGEQAIEILQKFTENKKSFLQSSANKTIDKLNKERRI